VIALLAALASLLLVHRREAREPAIVTP
jgi:hypothetical protein